MSASILHHGSTIGRVSFLSTLLGSILAAGAVMPMAMTATACGFGIAAWLGTWTPPSTAEARRSYHLCFALGLVLALYCVFQSWSFAGNDWAHPLWRLSSRLIGPTQSAVSVDPAATKSAILPLLIPFVSYAAALSLFGTDEAAMKLLRWLVAIAVGFAAFGILQVSWLTDSMLFLTKTAYLESLTSVFVNRNTAGTLLGVASLLALALVIAAIRNEGDRVSVATLLSAPNISLSRKMRVVVPAMAMALILLALFLTKSRGALGSTLAAYLIITPLLIFNRRSRDFDEADGARPGVGRRPLILVAAFAVILTVAAVFGGMAIDRMEVRGVDVVRLCLYESSIDAIRENWLFGTGFGTFKSVFPSFRLPGCGYFRDVFHRAHNVYLEGLLGLGLVFVPALLVVVIHVARVLVTGLRERRRQRYVPIIGIGVVLLVGLHSLVDFSLQVPGFAAYFAACLGALSTICLGRRQHSRNSSARRAGSATSAIM